MMPLLKTATVDHLSQGLLTCSTHTTGMQRFSRWYM